MKNRLFTKSTVLVFLCLLLAGAAQADVVKKCFIDGNDWAQQTGTYALSYDFHRLTVAAEGSLWARYCGLRGALDEFAIYDKILDDANIAAHANAVTPEDYNSLVAAGGPVLWLKFEDPCSASGYTAADSSGNGLDGTYIGDGKGGLIGDVNLVTGYLGNAAEFYGTYNPNGTCIDIDDANGALEMNDLTVEFWIKSSDLYGGYQRFFSHCNGGVDGYGGGINNDANTPTVVLIGGGSANWDPVDDDMGDGEWHHVAFTFDSTPDPNWDVNIEAYSQEVMDDNPALYLRLDDFNDSSGNNYWVDADSAVELVGQIKGSMGGCALLNAGWIAAANQQTEPSSDPCYGHEYAFGDDITVEFWLYYPPGTTVDLYAGLWTQNAGEDVTTWSPACTRAGDGCRMRCNDNRDGGDGYAYTNYEEIAWASDANYWHHYVMIYDVCDSPAQINVQWWTDAENYKNRTYDTSVFDNYLGPEMDHILFGNVGTRFVPGNNAYRQYVDEIAVYPHALSQVRIQAHYDAFQPKDCNEIWYREMADEWEGIDKNKDCDIDFYDYALFAQEWALCNRPDDCPPDWP